MSDRWRVWLLAVAVGASAASSGCGAPTAGRAPTAGTPEAAGSRAAEPETGAAPAAEGRAALLSELRSRLDEVRMAEPEVHLERGGDLDVSPLVGATGDEIRAVLGEPLQCMAYEVLVAPCQDPSDWFYSFYHLPAGSRGGGPELLLRFDGGEVCTSASWAFTE